MNTVYKNLCTAETGLPARLGGWISLNFPTSYTRYMRCTTTHHMKIGFLHARQDLALTCAELKKSSHFKNEEVSSCDAHERGNSKIYMHIQDWPPVSKALRDRLRSQSLSGWKSHRKVFAWHCKSVVGSREAAITRVRRKSCTLRHGPRVVHVVGLPRRCKKDKR